MSEKKNPFIGTSQKVDVDTVDPQERNRLWWERMPMTYAEWDEEQRLPEGEGDLVHLEEHVLAGSPYLRGHLDFAGFKGKRVLDLGCGSGIFSCLFAKGGAQAVAVDLTETATSLGRQTADAHGVDLMIARMDAEKLAFQNAAFDYVYSWGVLHHTNRMEDALAELGRVLKPGGTGLVMVYHRHSLVYCLHGLFWLLLRGKIFQGHGLNSVQDFYTDGYYHRYLSRKEFAAAFKSAGLNPVRLLVTQYEKKLLPWTPAWFDRYLKSRFGMCLVAEVENPA